MQFRNRDQGEGMDACLHSAGMKVIQSSISRIGAHNNRRKFGNSNILAGNLCYPSGTRIFWPEDFTMHPEFKYFCGNSNIIVGRLEDALGTPL